MLARELLRDPSTARRCAARCTTATTAPARRVPGHRPDPDRAGRAASPLEPTPTPAPTGTSRRRRRAGCSSSATRSSRSTGSAAPTSACSSTARDRFGDDAGAAHHQLPHGRARLDWVNDVFGRPDRGQPTGASPPTSRSTPDRDGCAGGPGRRAARRPQPTTDDPAADELREREAGDVAAAIAHRARRRLAGRRQSRRTGERRPARATSPSCAHPHLAARTSKHALDAAGIPYRAETSSLVYGTQEVRDLLAALRAIDDPTDELALVAALRSPLFGCGDDDLFTWQARPAAAGTSAPTPPDDGPDDDHPVGHGDAPDLRPICTTNAGGWRRSELLERLVARAPAARARPRRAPAARRVAPPPVRRRPGPRLGGGRAAATCGPTSTGPTARAAEAARVAEALLPETDDDAVRILTIHGAKGLEFPIAIVSGMTRARRRPRRRRRAVVRDGGSRCDLAQGSRHRRLRRLPSRSTSRWTSTSGSACSTSPHPRPRPPRRVVSTAPSDADPADRDGHRRAELLAGAGERRRRPSPRPGDIDPRPPTAGAGRRAPERVPATGPTTALAVGTTARRSRAAPAAGRRVGHDAGRATAAQPRAVDDDPGLDQGRAATSSCRRGPRAATAPPSAGPCTPCCRPSTWPPAPASPRRPPRRPRPRACSGAKTSSTAWPGRRSQSPRVRQRRPRPHWRELYVAAPVGDRLLEGYVDLLYRDRDGLVVVDYKTDHAPDDARSTSSSSATACRGRPTRAGGGGHRRSRRLAASSSSARRLGLVSGSFRNWRRRSPPSRASRTRPGTLNPTTIRFLSSTTAASTRMAATSGAKIRNRARFHLPRIPAKIACVDRRTVGVERDARGRGPRRTPRRGPRPAVGGSSTRTGRIPGPRPKGSHQIAAADAQEPRVVGVADLDAFARDRALADLGDPVGDGHVALGHGRADEHHRHGRERRARALHGGARRGRRRGGPGHGGGAAVTWGTVAGGPVGTAAVLLGDVVVWAAAGAARASAPRTAAATTAREIIALGTPAGASRGRPHRLDRVGGADVHRLGGPLVLEGLVERGVERIVEQALGEPEGDRRPRGRRSAQSATNASSRPPVRPGSRGPGPRLPWR